MKFSGATAMLACLLAAIGPVAASSPVGGAARAGADNEIAAFLRGTDVPAVAASPGGTPVQLPPGSLASTALTPQSTARSSSRAPLAAKLAAKEIESYRCASLSTGRKVGAQSNNGATAAAVTWPSACSVGSGTVTGWLAVDRRNACDHEQFNITITEYSTTAPPASSGPRTCTR